MIKFEVTGLGKFWKIKDWIFSRICLWDSRSAGASISGDWSGRSELIKANAIRRSPIVKVLVLDKLDGSS